MLQLACRRAIMALALTFPSRATPGFLDDVGKAVTAPIRAPIQATKDVLRGAPPGQIIRNQLDVQYGPKGRCCETLRTRYKKVVTLLRTFHAMQFNVTWAAIGYVDMT